MTEAFLFLQPINQFPDFHASWIPRLPEINVHGDRAFALKNLAPAHDQIITHDFPEIQTRHHAEQIHGAGIQIISKIPTATSIEHPGVDGLMTNLPNQLLAIYVADCAAVYLIDPVKKAIALLHSGKKGTELDITGKAIAKMTATYGTDPADLICTLSPCIRPPDYEIDFPQKIRQNCLEHGVRHFHDSSENTAADLKRHYSYRLEKGQTGRMLALLSLK